MNSQGTHEGALISRIGRIGPISRTGADFGWGTLLHYMREQDTPALEETCVMYARARAPIDYATYPTSDGKPMAETEVHRVQM